AWNPGLFASRRIELTAAGDRAWVSKPTSYEDQEKIGQQRRETQPLVSGRHLSSDRASAPGGSCFLGGMSALMLSRESRSTVEDSGFPKGGPFYGSVCLWCRYKPRVGHHLTAASRPPRRDWNQSPAAAQRSHAERFPSRIQTPAQGRDFTMRDLELASIL